MSNVICSNFDDETSHSDLEQLFSKYGKVKELVLRVGYALVYFDDYRAAQDAIRSLDGRPFGVGKRRLSVDLEMKTQGCYGCWTHKLLTKKMFVSNFEIGMNKNVICSNFDDDTSHSDLEQLFSKYGKVKELVMGSGYALVYFGDYGAVEDAIRSLDGRPFGVGK